MSIVRDKEIDHDRRRFFGAAAVTIAAAQFALNGSADAHPKTKAADLAQIKRGKNTTFTSLKQVNAGVLNVGYAEAGPADGPAVILLHGWPYDIYSYVDVAPALAEAGYRVIVPYLRGYGTTRFLLAETPRNGQPSALAADVIDLMDALKIEKATVGGFDWGGRSADIVAALWPERCKALVSVSGYLIGSQASGKNPLPPKAELQWWYQYYFATERGRAGYDKYRRDFAKLIWQLASPKWTFDDATFDRSAAAFDNPDHVDIVVTITDGGLAWRRASRNLTTSRSGLLKVRSFPYRRSPWKAMPTVPHTRRQAHMPRSSRAGTHIGASRAASDTICPRRLRKPSSRPSWRRPRVELSRQKNAACDHAYMRVGR